jgi:hypothetical protein
MALLQTLQGLLITLDGRLQLTDILRTTFTEGSLGLSVTLLPFLRGSINLGQYEPNKNHQRYWIQGDRNMVGIDRK